MLVQNLTVDGFDTGVLAASQESTAKFEGLTLVYAIYVSNISVLKLGYRNQCRITTN